MAIRTSELSKPQWQYNKEKTHRVIIFSKGYDVTACANHLYDKGLVEIVIDELKDCPKCHWADQHNIELIWQTNDNMLSWERHVIISAELSNRQFFEYTLRFTQ